MPTESKEAVCISAVGMVSPLGLDAANSCAAWRAGISRSRELDFRTRSAEDGRPEKIVGHSVPQITEGFQQNARLLRLCQAAFSDLRSQAEFAATVRDVYASVPSPLRVFS